MIYNYIIAVLIVFAALLGWALVQRWSRSFAARHPEFRSAKEEGSGCSFMCFCKNKGSCPKKTLQRIARNPQKPLKDNPKVPQEDSP